MARPRSAHRRNFLRTTILATIALLVSLAATVASVVAPIRSVRGWVVRVLGLLAAVGLALLTAVSALVTLGGAVILYRDACEERGLPYTPARRRERVLSSMTAAIRRSIRPNAGLRPGEVAEVRSLPEILATLDERGCLDGLPFMPEMAKYCGYRFEVQRRVDKVWEYAHGTGVRKVRGAVLLEALRCDGQSHGSCQAACQLIWKEAWLRPPRGSVAAPATGGGPDLEACTHTGDGDDRRYICQMTEIIRASTPMSRTDPRHYARDVITGNSRLAPLAVVLGIRLFSSLHWRLAHERWPVIKPSASGTTPHADLGLQPGQWVRVKSKHEIEATLNGQLRNRGLELGTDMLFCCGGSYRVAARIDRILDERTGELLVFKTPSILLEGAHANGGTVLTPQNEFFFWREIWLEPQPAALPAEPGT